MKIEKVNDNQIRCTLTREDLDSRQIKLSELAYGTDKAKSLFRELMQQASYEFGFEAEDIPLMIEAIPISSEKIILIVTKVEYPDELDTRFSKFSDMADDMEDIYEDIDLSKHTGSANDIIDLFKKAKETLQQKQNSDPEEKIQDTPLNVPVDISKLYVFCSLEDVLKLSHILNGYYHGQNTLYHNHKNQRYYLVVNKSSHTPEEFNKVCNILSEYGTVEELSVGSTSFLDEHLTPMIQNDALCILSGI